MATRALLILAVVGCGSVAALPEPLDPVRAFLVEHEAAPPEHADEATALALRELSAVTGTPIPVVGIRWWDGPLLMLDGYPQGATGIEFACGDIWVWVSPANRVSDTAVVHELGHCLRIAARGDNDSAHTDSDWWTIVSDEIRALQKTGL